MDVLLLKPRPSIKRARLFGRFLPELRRAYGRGFFLFGYARPRDAPPGAFRPALADYPQWLNRGVKAHHTRRILGPDEQPQAWVDVISKSMHIQNTNSCSDIARGVFIASQKSIKA